ncbi:SRPBCC family protein [Bacillus horti]|uniref:Uncharacterized protein YndB with AHSA1/START domain n=1 Tax=Caldalkalibacillus horti TaxID=77523 RepID=A0ABT9VZ30_9BACI|nr:SRPBCC domain-containing protein [Bacillus horti]MDQ0166258.1 uncharacterized protein YndB with AHSA1/START domain [Bacillus horti]
MAEQKSDKVVDITKRVVYKAPIEKVWNAVATSEGIEAWFMPNTFKAEVGAEFHIDSQFERSSCKVLELEPPYRLSFTWGEQGWVVSFELKDLNGETEFTLIHSGWGDADEIIPASQQSNKAIRERMNQGWEGIVDQRLRKVVEE